MDEIASWPPWSRHNSRPVSSLSLLGLAGALAASALTRSMVFGVSALNPFYVAAAVAVMILVAFAAIIVPVLRATGVDPVQALRTE